MDVVYELPIGCILSMECMCSVVMVYSDYQTMWFYSKMDGVNSLEKLKQYTD